MRGSPLPLQYDDPSAMILSHSKENREGYVRLLVAEGCEMHGWYDDDYEIVIVVIISSRKNVDHIVSLV